MANILGGAATGASIGGSIGGGVGAAIGGIGGAILGLFGGKRNEFTREDQEKLMDRAWGYETQGMALQYGYLQQAAEAEQQRNLEMWNKTNAEAQRQHLENAGLSVGLMYGNGGAQAASTAGGKGMQPEAPKTNPVEVAMQMKQLNLQNKSIETQNILNLAQAAKSAAEAKKIGGVDTKKVDLEIKWQEIENRIQNSREEIEANNITKAMAESQKAVEEWNQAIMNTDYLNETYEQRVIQLTEEVANLQKQGFLMNSELDINYSKAKKIEKEIENFQYEVITRRMLADAAKKEADNMLKKIDNEYDLGIGHLKNEDQKNIREWIYGGIEQISDIISAITGFKQAERIIKAMGNKVKKTKGKK